MSYQVLARKWRPQRFSEVVGQQHVLSALENSLREDRLHHAYLFSGTRGVGKTSIARLFAKGLNCVNGSPPSLAVNVRIVKRLKKGILSISLKLMLLLVLKWKTPVSYLITFNTNPPLGVLRFI